MYKSVIRFIAAVVFSFFLFNCRTVHFDRRTEALPNNNYAVKSKAQEITSYQKEEEAYAIEEKLKEVDVEQTVIYIDRPIYTSNVEKPPVADVKIMVKDSLASANHLPIKYNNGVIYYAWDDTFVYEIHTQPYRVTDIELEPGEEVIEMPFISENSVWEISAGVSQLNGFDVQHFFVKPSQKDLTTSFIIITNKRIYHLLLKSFPSPVNGKDEHYMAMVRWQYPPVLPFTVKNSAGQTFARNKGSGQINRLTGDLALVNPEFLSFDYKMFYSIFKKPIWLPTRIYDDGRKTYIVMDEKMLNMESPVLFNKSNERINYRVQKNLIIIDELIEKVTLKRGNERVTIEKKNYSGNKEVP